MLVVHSYNLLSDNLGLYREQSSHNVPDKHAKGSKEVVQDQIRCVIRCAPVDGEELPSTQVLIEN